MGLTISAFADRMAYDRNYVSAVEKGAREPGPRFLKQLAILEREAGLVKFGENARVEEDEPAYGHDRALRVFSDRLLIDCIGELMNAGDIPAEDRLRLARPYQAEMARRARQSRRD